MKIEENALIDNSLGIQSRCKLLVKLQNIEDLNKIHDLIKSNKKYFIHGEGTNIVPPSFYDGLVLKADFNHINLNKNILNVGSAYNWTELVKFCIKNDINGFENLIDIPGSVGASPVQNIGAYGADVSSLIESIDCFCLKTFKQINLNNKDCKFSYRDSILKNSHYLIYNLNFKANLKENINSDYASIQKYMHDNSFNTDNLNKQDISTIISKVRAKALPNPDHIFNAGSFFKNPIIHKNQINFEYFSEDKLIIWDYSDTLVKVGAARLIELIQHQLSLPKNVSIYKNHSLVLITNGKATQQEVLNFASHINEIVYKTFNISLEIEPNIIN